MLEKLGLTAERVNRSSGAKPGTVLDIQESSSRVEVGSTVTLVVASAQAETDAHLLAGTDADADTHADQDTEADTDEDDRAADADRDADATPPPRWTPTCGR